MKVVNICGGGISGLTCGLRLSEAGFKVRILEKEDVLGGLARSFEHNGKSIPLVYHHVMEPDSTTLDFIKVFGLDSQLKWIKSDQVFWYDQRPYLLSKPLHIFSFAPLDLMSKFKLFRLGILIWLKSDWSNLRNVNCDDWLNKMVGPKATQVLFQNLMDIKFNMPLTSISMEWLGKRLHQSVRNVNKYGYIDCGWQKLIALLADKIKANGGDIITGVEITQIQKNLVICKGASGNIINFFADLIINTLPPPVFNRLVSLSEKQLPDIKFKSIISFICGSRNRISKYYWSVVLKPHLIFGGFFNHSILTRDNNEDIYYFFTYLDNDDPWLSRNDADLKSAYLNDIRKLFPDFEPDWVKIFKLRFSQPVFVKDYVNPDIEFSDGVYLAGIYRGFPRPRTMDSAFISGEETAQYIINKYEKK